MLSAVIQAGGQSRRMGQDKGLVSFLGQKLIERVIERLKPIASEVLVTTNQPESYLFLGLPLFPDPIPGMGALGGLFTALNAAHHPLVVVVACDMPFVNASMLAAERDLCLNSGVDLVIPQTDAGLEPFHAVYRKNTCLPAVKSALDNGERKVIAWLRDVNVLFFSPSEARQYDPRQLAFLNVNTLEELKLAEQMAKE